MSSGLNEIGKIFKVLFIIMFIEFILLFSFFITYTSNYDKNVFEIKLNGTLMKCYYSEKYSNGFLLNAKSSGYNSVKNQINKINLDDKIFLEVNEYEVYYKNGHRKRNTSAWYKSDDYEYKLIQDSNVQIQIKRMDKILYDGKFISDLSRYINENGRYYIHIYSTRKDGLFNYVKTHISFNVIVGGGNYDSKN